MKKNIKHFFLLTALAAGTIHFVNRFINMTADKMCIRDSLISQWNQKPPYHAPSSFQK